MLGRYLLKHTSLWWRAAKFKKKVWNFWEILRAKLGISPENNWRIHRCQRNGCRYDDNMACKSGENHEDKNQMRRTASGWPNFSFRRFIGSEVQILETKRKKNVGKQRSQKNKRVIVNTRPFESLYLFALMKYFLVTLDRRYFWGSSKVVCLYF